MRNAMDRLVEENFSDVQSDREWMLAVDVQAGEEDYTIRALVPGLEAEDVSIEIINNTVSIRGEFPKADEDARFLANELPGGSFARTITLPTALDPSKAEANIKNGVLGLKVPKAESHRPRTIKVNIG
jgi:HSP20 family protein